MYNFYTMFYLNRCVISLYCSILMIYTCSAISRIVDTVLYALGSVSTVHKACFSHLMQQLNQISAGARCLSVLITMPHFNSFWFLAMKPNISIFSFSHWGITQSTNKRVKRIAYFYSTNLRAYILYILFISVFTIKYNLPFPIHVNNICLLISKICEPPDLFLSPRHLEEFQERFLRCGIKTMHTAFHLIGTCIRKRPPSSGCL